MMSNIAIVGAGLSGLSCARHLAKFGISTTVFERRPYVGGRVATRSMESNLSFDHGAQYFTVRHPAFREFVDDLISHDVVAEWKARFADVDREKVSTRNPEHPRYVGVPTMRSICDYLADHCHVEADTEIVASTQTNDGWILRSSGQATLGPFDALILACPPAQAARLIPENSFRLQLQSLPMNPCWAAMVAFDEPLSLPFDAAFVHDSILSWIARNSSKPGRYAAPDCWVLHAAADWSRNHIEDSHFEIADKLAQEFALLTKKSTLKPIHCSAHRWRFSIPMSPLENGALFDTRNQLGVCGDWAWGARIEAAFLSGRALSERMMRGSIPT